jgi:hypothetical protein
MPRAAKKKRLIFTPFPQTNEKDHADGLVDRRLENNRMDRHSSGPFIQRRR